MERDHTTRLIGIIRIAGAVLIVLALSIEKIYAAIPTIKVPGAYPYEETVQVPAPPPRSRNIANGFRLLEAK
jgi:hypothetical protein